MATHDLTFLAEKLERALGLHRAGRLVEAQAGYEEILSIQPAHVEAINLLGAAAIQSGNPRGAVEWFAKAIELDPNDPGAYINSGLALRELRQLEAALARIEQAIRLKPDCADAYLNRGLVLCELRRWDAALASYERAIALEPDYAEAHLARGRALSELDHLEAALASCDQAIAIVDDYEDAHVGRAALLHRLGQPEAALASYDRAIALKPDYATAHHGRSQTLLLLGEFETGWNDHEWRWQDIDSPVTEARRNFPEPLWLGRESIAGRTILLHSEQGLGDTLHFCRYARWVADLGARVILEVQQPLESLLDGLQGVSQVIARGDALPPFDLQCPLLSLPLAFNTRLGTIPCPSHYLRSDAEKVARWQARLGTKTRGRIGLVWSGSRIHKNDHNRSIPLADFIRHFPADFDYVSLQKDVRESDWKTLQAHPAIRQFADELHDLSDTAALCECMDLVVSVDTSVAHLSAALGRDTWILLPFVPDWRWLLDREDSPWYSSVRLFRQRSRGDWSTVTERVGAELMQPPTSAGSATNFTQASRK
jgi:tetratricopeptide (TPR) repeat protein